MVWVMQEGYQGRAYEENMNFNGIEEERKILEDAEK